MANSSDRLFNVLSQSDLTNDSFSSRQRLHLEPPAAREGTRLIMDHLMVNFRLLCLSFHAYLESSVSVEYRTLFKDFLWFAKRSLNVPAVIPIYSFRLSNVSRSNLSFINNAFCQAFSIKRTFISCTAITVFVSRWFVPFLQ